ncbi:MAG: sortase [Firmicutes bacterium]|nr:sortase [Bacillota bacterium]
MKDLTAMPSAKRKNIKRKLRDNLAAVLIVLGVTVLAFPFLTEGYGYIRSAHLMKAWEKQAASQRAQASKLRKNQELLISLGKLPNEESIIGSTGKVQTKGQKRKMLAPFPKTKIIIPKIGVNQVVLEGTGPEVLQLGPGHYTGTANPGDRGNVGIAGHRVTFTHPFNRLDELSRGDIIILETVDFIYEYQVDKSVITDPSDTSNLQLTSDPRVTLTTCNPKYSAKTRLNVIGVLVNSKPQHISIMRAVKNIFKDVEKDKRGERPKTRAELLQDFAKAKAVASNNPVDAAAYINLAKAAFVLDKYAECYQAIKKADLIEPESPEVQEVRLALIGKKESLQEEVSKAESNSNILYSGDPSPYLELGRFYYETEDYQEAIDIFRKAIDIFPYTADMYIYEAKAYEKLGQNDSAIEAYRQALAFDPTNSEAINGINNIKNKKPADAFNVNRLHYLLRPQ